MKPGKFKHSGLDFVIHWMEDGSFNEDYRGRTFNDDQKVCISSRLPEQGQRVTLIHEILHVCSRFHLDNESDLTEAQIRPISIALFDILSNNPELAKFIIKGDD